MACAGFIANRADLIRRCDLSHASSDRQILLHLYQQKGSRAMHDIAGPFAWIVWDGDRQELLAVRDRMGTQGLYYAVCGDTLVVASRVESVLERLSGPTAFNPGSVVAHINRHVPLAGESFYERIHSVEPGGLLSATREKIAVRTYWCVEPQPTLKLASDAEYAEAFRELLFRVVAEYTPSQSVAVALSGGLDSTTVAAAIRTVAPDVAVTAVTVVAPELPESDEGPPASGASMHLNMASITVRADHHWPLSAREGIRTSKGTPHYNLFRDVWDVAFPQTARQGIGVVFTGFSGDHLFDFVSAYPDLLVSGRWLELAGQIRVHLGHAQVTLARLIRATVLRPIARTYGPRWLTTRGVQAPWLAKPHRQWYQDNFGRPKQSWLRLPGKRQRILNLRHLVLPYRVAEWNQHAAVHHLEARHPLLDHRLVEFAVSLPTTQTYRAGLRKLIMRQAMRGYLPDELLDRRGNIYTRAVVDRGLREREHAKVWPLMTNMRAAQLGFVDEGSLRHAYSAYLSGAPQAHSFWETLTLEDWLRRHF